MGSTPTLDTKFKLENRRFYATIALFPATYAGVAQLVRALPCHGRGCGFKSRLSRKVFTQAEIAQLVEHIHGKDEVASSILALGSRFLWKSRIARVAQLVERRYRKPQVAGSIPASGSRRLYKKKKPRIPLRTSRLWVLPSGASMCCFGWRQNKRQVNELFVMLAHKLASPHHFNKFRHGKKLSHLAFVLRVL